MLSQRSSFNVEFSPGRKERKIEKGNESIFNKKNEKRDKLKKRESERE